MTKYLSLVTLLTIFTINLYTQIVTGETKAVQLKIEPQYKLTLPPNLYVNMEFSDANGNGIIEAEEKAILNLEIFNKGAGPAQGLSVKLTSLNYDPAFTIGDEIYIRSIEPGQSQKISIPFTAGLHVKECTL